MFVIMTMVFEHDDSLNNDDDDGRDDNEFHHLRKLHGHFGNCQRTCGCYIYTVGKSII